jgi:hypothetical protein
VDSLASNPAESTDSERRRLVSQHLKSLVERLSKSIPKVVSLDIQGKILQVAKKNKDINSDLVFIRSNSNPNELIEITIEDPPEVFYTDKLAHAPASVKPIIEVRQINAEQEMQIAQISVSIQGANPSYLSQVNSGIRNFLRAPRVNINTDGLNDRDKSLRHIIWRDTLWGVFSVLDIAHDYRWSTKFIKTFDSRTQSSGYAIAELVGYSGLLASELPSDSPDRQFISEFNDKIQKEFKTNPDKLNLRTDRLIDLVIEFAKHFNGIRSPAPVATATTSDSRESISSVPGHGARFYPGFSDKDHTLDETGNDASNAQLAKELTDLGLGKLYNKNQKKRGQTEDN